MKHKLESRLPGEISITQDMQMPENLSVPLEGDRDFGDLWGSLVPLHFLHKGGVICISEVIDISPGNLDSSFCFIQSSISHDVLCI